MASVINLEKGNTLFITRLLTLYGSLFAKDPLESEEELATTLEMFATVARTKYVDSGRYILAEFKDLSKKYRELIQMASAGSTSPTVGSNDFKERLSVVEMQLAWMVYMIAAIVGGRVVSFVVSVEAAVQFHV